jgi:outer membrane autotransporter protein
MAGWNVWGSAYGGAGHLNGDAAVIGSHDLSTSSGGVAAGADRFVTPNTRVGFALAGGFTGWGLADGLGGGHGDALQAGVYARTTQGPAYLAGALAFAEHWMSTDRFAMGDHLTADFNATSFAGRLEGGYRLPASYTPYIGVIPYAAIQAQRFHTPGFSETDVTGGGFGLTYDAQSSTDTRAELGSRFDKFIMLDRGAILALRGRIAWAHDWVTNPALTATFQALPGASFVVNGAAPKHDSALVTIGPEVTWRNGWSLMAKFDGEFASGAETYAGTARLRYAW